MWETIRIRCVRDREPVKRVARELGISKNTLKKYILAKQPPTMTRPRGRTASMAQFEADVDRLLRETPKITAKRITQVIRLTLDPTFRTSERAARTYVASRRARLISKETFVRLVYLPGDQVQFDSKDVVARIAGVETKLHMFVARLSYSTVRFARCYRSEDRPALFDGLLSSCVRFGGVPREGIFDNAKTAVKRVLRGRDRQVANEFAGLCGSLALSMQFAAPVKGNEKGGVEGLHGTIEDSVFRPMPDYGSIDELNVALAVLSEEHLEILLASELIRARFEREGAALRPLPEHLPSTCILEPTRINKFAEVTYKTNRYSVPSQFAHRDAVVEIFHNRLRVIVDTIAVAEHERSLSQNEAILDPAHFIRLLSFKHRAVERAQVFRHRSFHAALRTLLKGYVQTDPISAGKRFMRVIGLLEHHPMRDLIRAVEATLQRGTDDPSAIALALSQGQQAYQTAPLLQLPPGTRGSARPIVNLACYDVADLKEYTA
jgi:transposase